MIDWPFRYINIVIFGNFNARSRILRGFLDEANLMKGNGFDVEFHLDLLSVKNLNVAGISTRKCPKDALVTMLGITWFHFVNTQIYIL